MKKILSTLVAMATLATAGTSIINVSAEEYIKGDITGDGVLDVSDCYKYLQNYAKYMVEHHDPTGENEEFFHDPEIFKESYTSLFELSDEEYSSFDINSDGLVSSADACILIGYVQIVTVGYTGELAKEPVEEFFLALPEEQQLQLQEEFKEKAIELGYIKEYDEEVVVDEGPTEPIIYDLNGDGKFDEADMEIMEYLAGDVDKNGCVDSKDAVQLLSDYANSIVSSSTSKNSSAETATSDLFLGDLNGDGVADSRDAVIILQNYAKSIIG